MKPMEKHNVILEEKLVQAIQHIQNDGLITTKKETLSRLVDKLKNEVHSMWMFPKERQDQEELTNIYKSYGI